MYFKTTNWNCFCFLFKIWNQTTLGHCSHLHLKLNWQWTHWIRERNKAHTKLSEMCFPQWLNGKCYRMTCADCEFTLITLWLLTNILNFGIIQYATLKIFCHVSLVRNQTTAKRYVNVSVIVSLKLNKLRTAILATDSKIYNNDWVNCFEGKLYS